MIAIKDKKFKKFLSLWISIILSFLTIITTFEKLAESDNYLLTYKTLEEIDQEYIYISNSNNYNKYEKAEIVYPYHFPMPILRLKTPASKNNITSSFLHKINLPLRC